MSSLRRSGRLRLAGSLAAVATATALLAAPAAAHAATPRVHAAPNAVQTVYYDDSGAGSWQDDVTQATAIWNNDLSNVQFAPADANDPATVQIEATSGWPETFTSQPGSGEVDLGQEAVDEGYAPLRITAHELGHILGLPDDYDGNCAQLMSGHSAGTACTSADPDADEIAAADANFAGGFGHRSTAVTRVYIDGPASTLSHT